jgi:hypothetical protein
MIDASYVAGFFGLTDQRRPATFYKSAQEMIDAGESATAAWFRATIRKETLSVKDMALFSGTNLQTVSQTYSVQERLGSSDAVPQLYQDCRVYDEKERAWFSVVAVERTASDAIQTIYCAALRPGLTPQLAKTGD